MVGTESRLMRLVPGRLVGALEKERFQTRRGVVLFADVSGFSTLADELVRGKGAYGVDQLARILDATLRPLVDSVERHGGEVIGFPGDAILACWLEGEGAALPDLAQLAAQCALTSARKLSSLPPTEGVRLGVRQALSGGELRLMSVGASPRFAVVAGAPVGRLSGLLDETPAGGVVVGDELDVRGHLEGKRLLEVEPFADLSDAVAAARTATGPAISEERALAYVEPIFQRRLEASGEDWLAELREVSALFVHLQEPESDAQLATAVEATQRVIADHLGNLIEVVDDDKGVVMVAAFGLPGAEVARPDAPLAAAVEILEALNALKLETGIGVASGRTYFGRFGGSARATLGLRGSVLNRAARLMMLGPGVRCDEAAARDAGTSIELSEPEELTLKGFADPVQVHRVERGGGTRAQRNFVGHASLLQEARSSRSGVVLVLGEPGSGKTAFLDQVGRETAHRRVGASPGKRDTAGGALCLLLNSATTRTKAGDRAPLLGPAFATDWADTETTRSLNGFARANATRELIVEMLQSHLDAQTPLLIEDAQWLDDVSVEALIELSEHGPIIATARATGDRTPERLSGLARQGRVHVLDPLPNTAIDALARAELSLQTLPDGLSEWLGKHGNGRPGFVIELLALLHRRGLLVVSESVVRLFDSTALEDLSPPVNVEVALAGRLDELPPEAAKALKVAAAVGPTIDASGWRAGCEAVGLELAGQVPAIEAAGIIVRDGDDFRFSNALLQKVAHAQLVQGQRRLIHAALANWLESSSAARSSARRARLARHWGYAGKPRRALALLDVVFEDSMRQGLPRSAAHQAREALRLIEQTEEFPGRETPRIGKVRWRYRLARAYRAFGESDRCYEQLTLASIELGVGPPSTRAGWRWLLFRQAFVHLLHGVLPPRARASDERWLQGAVLSLFALVQFFRAQHPEALLATALRAVTHARRSLAPVPSSIAYSMVGIALTGSPRLSERYISAGEQKADDTDDPVERMNAAIGRLLVDLAHRRWSDIAALRERILPLAHANPDDHLGAVLLALLAIADLHVGELERCALRTEEMLQIADRTGYLQARGWGENIRITLALLAEDYEGALLCAENAGEILNRRREPDRLATRGLKAFALLRLGRLDEALEEVEALEPIVESEPAFGVTTLDALARPVEVWLAAHAARGEQGLLDRARVALKRFLKHAKPFPVWSPRGLALRGAVTRAEGGDGSRAFTRAAQQARERDQLTELAFVLALDDPSHGDLAELRPRLGAGWTRARTSYPTVTQRRAGAPAPLPLLGSPEP